MNTLNNYIEVCTVENLPAGQRTVITVNEKSIAVFNVDGRIYAIDNACPHAGSGLVSGMLRDNIITCRAHGMKFNITNGCYAGTSDAGVACYPIKIVDGKILVSVIPLI